MVKALRPHGNREVAPWAGAYGGLAARTAVRPPRPRLVPLHRPCELVAARIRPAAVRVHKKVFHATDFVWGRYCSTALRIADTPGTVAGEVT